MGAAGQTGENQTAMKPEPRWCEECRRNRSDRRTLAAPAMCGALATSYSRGPGGERSGHAVCDGRDSSLDMRPTGCFTLCITIAATLNSTGDDPQGRKGLQEPQSHGARLLAPRFDPPHAPKAP
jgi:hypothetical protein